MGIDQYRSAADASIPSDWASAASARMYEPPPLQPDLAGSENGQYRSLHTR
jgi:hypothetical protein